MSAMEKTKQESTFNAAEPGMLAQPLPRRDVSQQNLAHPARCNNQLGCRHNRNCSLGLLQQCCQFTASAPARWIDVAGVLDDLWAHATIGPIPGQAVLVIGFLFHASLIAFGIFTLKGQRAAGRVI